VLGCEDSVIIIMLCLLRFGGSSDILCAKASIDKPQ